MRPPTSNSREALEEGDNIPQDSVFISSGLVGVVPGGQDEAGLGLVHARADQVRVLQARPLDVDHALSPNRYLESSITFKIIPTIPLP